MRSSVTGWAAIAFAAAQLVAPPTAAAQPAIEPSFDVEIFQPVTSPHGSVAADRPETLRRGEFSAALLGSYAARPLRICTPAEGGSCDTDAVDARLGVVLLGAIGLGVVELGVAVPAVAAQSTGAPEMLVGGELSAGVGDIRVSAKRRLLARRRGALGVRAEVSLPTGNPGEFSGGPGTGFGLALLAQLSLGRAILALDAGVRLRTGSAEVGDLTVGNQVLAAASVEIAMTRKLALVGDAHGARGLVSGAGIEETPVELLGGVRARAGGGWSFVAMGGAGVGSGHGAPVWRAIAGVRWDHLDDDWDRDRIVNARDACPEAPEDRDAFHDDDGCPDPDNDGDRIADVRDRCPLEPEDADRFEDDDGCPDPDNDGDRIADAADGCPLEPEDADDFGDADGCPDPDNDGDGIADQADRCPDQAEIVNGVDDHDGCPDQGKALVDLTAQRIEIKETVRFATNKTSIQKASHRLLDQVASVLKNHAGLRVRIEGHADDRGTDEYNLQLSRDRTKAIADHLVGLGIDRSRLEHEGFGKTRPLATGRSARARARNRRVEFVVIE